MDSIMLLTRRGATCSDLLTCLYSLKPIELSVFYEVARRKEATVDEIAGAVNRDRTTTHRSLSKLVSAGLVYKQVKSISDGGYYHAYSMVEMLKIKEQARLKVREITDGLLKLVDSFDADFRRRLAA